MRWGRGKLAWAGFTLARTALMVMVSIWIIATGRHADHGGMKLMGK